MKYTHEIVGTHGGALLPERAPGACSGSKIPRVYRSLNLAGCCIYAHLTTISKYEVAFHSLSMIGPFPSDNDIGRRSRGNITFNLLAFGMNQSET